MAENPRIEELRRRVQADPASIAFAALAEEFRRVGRHEEAIDTCRTGLLRHPAYLSARVTLGRALIETGDFDGAREEFETVLRSAPENLAAIRGLSTIHERLGQSSEMDPHIAEQMKSMHAESIRVAVQPPPPPPEPVAAQPVAFEPIPAAPAAPVEAEEPFDPFKAFQSQPRTEPAEEFQPAPAFDVAPEPDAAFRSEPALEPQFLEDVKPAAQLEAEPSFDLQSRFEPPPPAEPEPQFEAAAEPEPEPQFEPAQAPEPELDLSLAPPLGLSIVMDPDLALMLEPESPADAEGAASSEPDPEVLATLARLERFLGSIQSLRA